MKKNVLALFCILLLISCKNEQQVKQDTDDKAVVKPSKLEVQINCKSDKSDILQCVFNRIEFKNNREGNYIITDNISESTKLEDFKYEMFNDNIVTLLQLKFGKQEKNLVVGSIILKYGENIITINGEDIDKYFALNKFIEYTPENSTIKTKMIKGKHFPSMTLKKGHVNKLFKIKL